MLTLPLTTSATPAPPVMHGPTDNRSIHDLVNEAVCDLGVVCVGVEDGRLYFELTKSGASSAELESLAHSILDRLAKTPDRVRTVLHSITSITLTLRA